ncbi:nucleotidyltransferase [Lederbergia citrea]|uniref:nucleotidyltransferase n=1 Tax=Lederbergia citrea TaxID=2833581 RepID=UPI001BC97659|nr:nucleotidyltransferase [Lederbergia citrea]MBS4177232.1 nucleotidyltransferase [Lederbergia citrea]
MKSVGIVAEYNPFHNGHLYHVQAAKRLSQSDVTIAVMSGNFLQRGEPALVSKWSRTKMALQSGVDIVIELPYAFAVQKAEVFAHGAIFLLNAMKCSGICFGSESGDIQQFIHTLSFMNDKKTEYDKHIRMFIKQGISYPSALALAYQELGPDSRSVDLSTPNNILGYHYVYAAAEINPRLNFYTVQRKSAGYHDESFSDATIASATSIRKSLNAHGNLSEIQAYIPHETLANLHQYRSDFAQFHIWEDYWPYLQYRLLSMNKEELREIYEVEEGLENRLIKAAHSADNFHSFMKAIKTKRYTWTRLQRLCVHILTNTRKTTIHALDKSPQYARLLGMSSIGREYLNQIKKELPIPLVSKLSAYENNMLMLDIRAADVYAHGLAEPYRRKLLAFEYRQPPIFNNA